MSERTAGIVFDPHELVPEAWLSAAASGPVRTFNPALLADGAGWIFAYRVVAADGKRRIALCRLDRELRVVTGSALPLSDEFRFRADAQYPKVVHAWFADPRLYRFGERLFVYWNSGWHEPQNHQFVHELDPRTLRPMGTARELLLATGERQKLEKNWTLFADAVGSTYAIYSVGPHRVLQFSFAGGDDITCEEFASTPWSIPHYPASHGGLRGGAPPVPTSGGFLSICHSVHDGPTGYRYAAAAYKFSGIAPFTPLHGPKAWLPLHNPFGESRIHGRLNPAVAEVLYPCGAAADGARWLVSHGINDEHCAITMLDRAALDGCLEPLDGAAITTLQA